MAKKKRTGDGDGEKTYEIVGRVRLREVPQFAVGFLTEIGDDPAQWPRFWRSPGWTELIWEKKLYKLTASQAAILKLLHDSAIQGVPIVHANLIRKETRIQTARLSQLFAENDLWGVVIVEVDKNSGRYRIAPVFGLGDDDGPGGSTVPSGRKTPPPKPVEQREVEYDDGI